MNNTQYGRLVEIVGANDLGLGIVLGAHQVSFCVSLLLLCLNYKISSALHCRNTRLLLYQIVMLTAVVELPQIIRGGGLSQPSLPPPPFLPLPSLSSPPLPSSSLFFPPSPIPSLPSGGPTPLIRLWVLGERLSSPSGSGQSLAATRFLVHFRLKRTRL